MKQNPNNYEVLRYRFPRLSPQQQADRSHFHVARGHRPPRGGERGESVRRGEGKSIKGISSLGTLLSETDNIVRRYTRQRGPEKSSMVPGLLPRVVSSRPHVHYRQVLRQHFSWPMSSPARARAPHRLVGVFSFTNARYVAHRGYSAGIFIFPVLWKPLPIR